jgi:nucleotide-binding universal stress UspA family protein
MRILLATDGSEHSRRAVEECNKLATGLKPSAIRIVTVIDNFTPMATEPFISPEEFLETVQKEIRENAEQIVSEAESVIREGNPDSIIEAEVLMGSPKKVIVREAAEWNADLVIMGSQGYGFWSRAVLGSVSNAVVHLAQCSVLIVKDPKNVKEPES